MSNNKNEELYLLWLLTQENEALKKRNKKIIQETLNAIIKTLEAKDKYTYGHSQRVADYSRLIAEKLSFSEEEIIEIELAAILHDIGKISTPDEILNKPGKLTDEEYEIIKEHPVCSFDIISQISSMDKIAKWIRAHQERVDGMGYPDGLKAEEIPLQARLITVADAFDAMTTDRPYRKALPLQSAYDERERCSGTQFDSEVVQVFLKEHKKLMKIEKKSA
jgi:putative nucleotidyltransferase with HDIG domain